MLHQANSFMWVLFFILSLSACNGSMGSRHKPSYLRTPLPEKNFAQYINKTKNLIVNATKGKLEPKWVEARLPFEFKPNKNKCGNSQPYIKGILLIHGLTDSPFMLRDIGNEFNKECYWVRSILLPGHGTIPGDLLNIKYSEWITATDAGIESFKKIVDELYIFGFSTGATLTLHHVLRKNEPDNIKGLILISPGIKENTSLGFVAGGLATLGKFLPRAAWLDVLPDNDKVKYESFPANAGAQFHYLTKEMRGLADKKIIKMPLFIAISSKDATVDPLLAKDFFCNRTQHPRNFMTWYTGDANIKEKNTICPGGTIKTKSISNKTLGVLNYSHLSLPVSPANNYYGKNGEYKNCLAYTAEIDALKQCEQKINVNSKVKYGEKNDENEGHPVRRLTFNPDFKNMMEEISFFIQSIKQS
ncbi:MAG: alpha/beta fold hydrolase [Nitrospinota bacterium]|nr:alpha/beta fold hydrolase [Nitrospinota bacterium]